MCCWWCTGSFDIRAFTRCETGRYIAMHAPMDMIKAPDTALLEYRL